MPYCSQCGAKNDEGARFCESCGKALAETKSHTVLSGSSAASLFQSLTFGKKISFSGASIGLICFFLPWVKACGMSISGLDIVTKGPTKEIGAPGTLFIILVPVCAVLIIYMIFKVAKGQMDKGSADNRILIVSVVPLVVLIIFFFWAKHKLQAPVDIFTFWFLLTILSFAGSTIGAYLDKSGNTS